jgi:predicted MPP superfamily phosphohydrolase
MITSRRTILLPVAALVLAGCGGEAADALPASEARSTGEPWEQMPADSLYGALPAENLRVTPVVLDVFELPDGWNGMRIAAISDLHLGVWEGNEVVAAAAVQRAMAANPDLIVLLGDYIDGRHDAAALARVLAPLRGRQALAVLGDRDIRTDSIEAAVVRTFAAAGIPLLRNSAVEITRGDGTGLVVGLDPDMATESWATQEYLLATIGGGGSAPLLLTHLPPLVARAPEGRFAAAVAGNTFCGQIEIPGTPRLSWLNNEAIPGAVIEGTERIYRTEGTTMFVTCGVGFGYLPVRLGAPPEVALITLRTAGAAPEQPAAPDTSAAEGLLEQYREGTLSSDTTG